MNTDNTVSLKNASTENISSLEKQILNEVQALRDYYIQLMTYVTVIAGLAVINSLFFYGVWWFIFPALGWGVFIAFKTLSLFVPNLFLGDKWQRREVEKRLKKADFQQL